MVNPAELFAKFETLKVVVVGDLILDINTYCEPMKPLDDGTPVYRRLLDPRRSKGSEYSFGGAALVVRNLLELGAQVDFITATGYGEGALHLSQWRGEKNLTLHYVQPPKPVTVKHRIWADGKKLLQLDTVDNTPISQYDADCLMLDYAQALREADVAIVADYRHGLISEQMAKEIVRLAEGCDVPLYVSSQVSQAESNHHWYGGRVFFIVSFDELKASEVVAASRHITTNGRYGAFRIAGEERQHWEAITVDAVDACGAGDAFLAAYALSEDMNFANTWAGLSTTVRGANPPTRDMYLEYTGQQRAA